MRKIVLAIILIAMCSTPVYSWWWSKKSEPITSDNIMDKDGYRGTLPTLDKHKIPDELEPKVVAPIYEPNEEFNDPSLLKPIPRDNPAFVNIILKTEKSSEYLNRINEMITYVERLIESIESEESDQLFIAKARVFKFRVDHLKSLYEGKPESYNASYKKLQEVGAQASTIATLRNEAVTYKRYLAYQTTGSVYNPANIALQLEYLLSELQDTLVILKDER